MNSNSYDPHLESILRKLISVVVIAAYSEVLADPLAVIFVCRRVIFIRSAGIFI